MQTIIVPDLVRFSGGVVLGTPSDFPAAPYSTPPNLYATAHLGDPSLTPYITIDVDPGYFVYEVGGLLFNGLTRSANYLVQGFNGELQVAEQVLEAVPANTRGGFEIISLVDVPITRVVITPDSELEWDFLLDSMTFNQPVADLPALIGAASRRVHGQAGPLDLPLALSGTPTIEPRLDGTAPQIVLTFSQPVEATDGSLDCGAEVVITNGTCHAVRQEGMTLIVDASLKSNACSTVTLAGLRKAGGGVDLVGDRDVRIFLYPGDVSASGRVNILDLQLIKNHLNKPVTAANCRFDVTVNGAINILDMQIIKNNWSSLLTCP